MKPYMFRAQAVPMPQSKDSLTLKHAFVHIWVMSDSIEKAKARAIKYIEDTLWEVKEVDLEIDVQPEQIQQLGKSEARLFRQASKLGIAADYIACRIDEGRPEDPVQIRPV